MKYFIKEAEITNHGENAIQLGAGVGLGSLALWKKFVKSEGGISNISIDSALKKFRKKYPNHGIVFSDFLNKPKDGNYYTKFNNDKNTGFINLADRKPSVFYHELGHGINDAKKTKITKLMFSNKNKAASIGSGILGLASALSVDPGEKNSKITNTLAATSFGLGLPTLVEEFRASKGGLNFAKKMKAPVSSKGKLALLGAFGTYLAGSVPGIYMGTKGLFEKEADFWEDRKNDAKYLGYLVKHKADVYVGGRALGGKKIPLIMHDWSKFKPSVWAPYRDYWIKGDKSPASLKRFRAAVKKHVNSETHHDYKYKDKGAPTVENYADWWAVSKHMDPTTPRNIKGFLGITKTSALELALPVIFSHIPQIKNAAQYLNVRFPKFGATGKAMLEHSAQTNPKIHKALTSPAGKAIAATVPGSGLILAPYVGKTMIGYARKQRSMGQKIIKAF